MFFLCHIQKSSAKYMHYVKCQFHNYSAAVSQLSLEDKGRVLIVPELGHKGHISIYLK